jgi:hypothetical protein
MVPMPGRHEQEPVVQTMSFPHAVPQAPQLFRSALTLTSHPVAALPSQSLKFVLHDTTVQTPAAQVSVAFVVLQARAQAPQFRASPSAMFVSQPLVAMPSQLPKPLAHDATAHIPLVHAAVP